MKNNIHFLFYLAKFSLNEKCFRQNCKENQNTHFILSNFFFFSENRAVCEIMWKNIV